MFNIDSFLKIKVYDFSKKKTVQTIQNKRLNSAFLNISCSASSEPMLLTNTSDGCVHLYEYNKSSEFAFVKKIDLAEMYQNYHNQNSNVLNESSLSSMLCTGLHLFSIENKTSLTTDNQNKNLIACVATSTFIFLIDLNASNLIYLVDFKNMPYNANQLNADHHLLPQVVEFSLSDGKQINAAMHSLFHNEIHVIRCADLFLAESAVNDNNETRQSRLTSNEVVLSVLPR